MSVDNINASYDKPAELDEIVFEHRNKEYGAYDLRKSYRPILTRSLLVGSALFLFAVLAPLVYLKIKEGQQKEETKVSVDLTDIKDIPPPEQEKELPPPPPPPPVKPPEQEIVKDMIPEPKPNPKVEEPPKKIEEVKETTIGTVNQEGEKIAKYTPPPPPANTGAGKNVEAPKPVGNEIVDRVDQEAAFTGGIDKFRNLFQSNFDNSSVEGEGTMKTTVTFVVERDGSLSDVKASGPNSDFNREAERTIRSIKGKWSPGKLNGDPVRSRFRFPVTMNFE
ncbi:energy transducer TonB [Elizabethkingia ursingii]|uniref:Energy transducer TonB n=1 Tax=Elizabethkingia ursingii TaxID=1756150 RepID=A0AAJ3TNJ8_9FLAO|nr:energy transducer TonB [Elizabethkingia ursingii]AQX09106.1 energy transducer TonB [Elizabethkingia ursingii]OPB74526.1 energy transducer TonB [Elizabethkingia ursingii]